MNSQSELNVIYFLSFFTLYHCLCFSFFLIILIFIQLNLFILDNLWSRLNITYFAITERDDTVGYKDNQISERVIISVIWVFHYWVNGPKFKTHWFERIFKKNSFMITLVSWSLLIWLMKCLASVYLLASLGSTYLMASSFSVYLLSSLSSVYLMVSLPSA